MVLLYYSSDLEDLRFPVCVPPPPTGFRMSTTSRHPLQSVIPLDRLLLVRHSLHHSRCRDFRKVISDPLQCTVSGTTPLDVGYERLQGESRVLIHSQGETYDFCPLLLTGPRPSCHVPQYPSRPTGLSCLTPTVYHCHPSFRSDDPPRFLPFDLLSSSTWVTLPLFGRRLPFE